MLKGLALSALIAVAGVAFATPAFAYTSPGVPTGYVNDFAHVLRAETVSNLDAELAAFEASTSNEITVVTIPSMGGDYIENYAVKLFEEWGIGKKNTDNGVLLLLAIEERKLRIEVGYGLEGALPDSVAARIIADEMTPRLKVGDYDGAVTSGVTSIVAATKGEYQPDNMSPNPEAVMVFLFVGLIMAQFLLSMLARSKSWWFGGVFGMVIGFIIGLGFGTLWFEILFVIIFGGIGFLIDYVVSNVYHRSRAFGKHPPWWLGGGGGGGFGGFGGGSSGGGGASGSW
ncbi:MAG: TPM domain-containing protein [bacterium]|nr:TPM domain-containing protein [bacterium]